MNHLTNAISFLGMWSMLLKIIITTNILFCCIDDTLVKFAVEKKVVQ